MESKNGTFSRKAFFWLSLVFASCVAAQAFLAGYATFVNPVKWSWHTAFVKMIEYLPIMMLIVGLVGKLPKRMIWQSLGLFLLIMLMYATANMTSVVPVSGAFHPVIALAMFWLSVSIVSKAWRLTRGER